MEKKNTGIIVLIVVLIIIVLGLGGFIVYDKVINNNVTEIKKDTDKSSEKTETVEENNDGSNNQDEIKELFSWSNPNFVIPDSEINKLYNYVKSDLSYTWWDVCFMNYYQNPFDKNNMSELVSIVAQVYAKPYISNITPDLVNHLSSSTRSLIEYSDVYVDGNIIRRGLEEIFNVDTSKVNFATLNNYPESFGYNYIEEADMYVNDPGGGGGSYDAVQIQQIISYQKNENKINMIVVKAEINDSEIDINNGESIVPAGIYRYFYNADTLVYKNMISNDFTFTKENVDKFPQIKYVFRKNDSGKYYVYDIINLNYQNEYASCN